MALVRRSARLVGALIPVEPQAEPPGFDDSVRARGRAWLALHRAEVDSGERELQPFWRTCLPDLHRLYDGFCAYSTLYIPRAVGNEAVEHFVPKSKSLDRAYEWSNYRLACARMNSRKGVFEDVLDPFELEDGTFQLDPVTARIHPAAGLELARHELAQQTIDRLHLNDSLFVEARAFDISVFREGAGPAQRTRLSRFVHAELVRLKMLPSAA